MGDEFDRRGEGSVPDAEGGGAGFGEENVVGLEEGGESGPEVGMRDREERECCY